MMGGYLSPRTTLCLLAGVGALAGGVAGAAVVGKLATDGSTGVLAAREEPAAAAPGRATQVAVVAAQSPLRQPTPWSADAAKAARQSGERPRAARRHPPARAVVKSPRRSAAPARSRAPVVARANAPTTGGGVAAPPVTSVPAPQTSAPVRSPAQPPARAPEPAPKASRPSPQAAPAHTPPKPDPTGAFDDSG